MFSHFDIIPALTDRRTDGRTDILRRHRPRSTLGPVSAWMGDRIWVGKLYRYVTSHPGQLTLAIPLWVGAMSTSLGWEDKRRSGVVVVVVVYLYSASRSASNALIVP